MEPLQAAEVGPDFAALVGHCENLELWSRSWGQTLRALSRNLCDYPQADFTLQIGKLQPSPLRTVCVRVHVHVCACVRERDDPILSVICSLVLVLSLISWVPLKGRFIQKNKFILLRTAGQMNI